MFFFKPSKIVLDCFTDNATVYRFASVDYASAFIPDWWKQTPKTLKAEGSIAETGTIKRCRGLIDYYNKGIVIPWWSDFVVKLGTLNKPGVWFEFADKKAQVAFHPEEQRNSWCPNTTHNHMKLLSPWAFRTKEDVKFAWTQPAWNYERLNDFTLLPAVVDYKYQNGSDVNLMFDFRETERELSFKANTPLAHMIPLTERSVELKVHLVDRSEIDKIRAYPLVFNNNYNFKKSGIDSKRSCPLGFK